MFPFMGQTGGELSFNAGDIINLIDYSHDVHAPPSCLVLAAREAHCATVYRNGGRAS